MLYHAKFPVWSVTAAALHPLQPGRQSAAQLHEASEFLQPDDHTSTSVWPGLYLFRGLCPNEQMFEFLPQ